jgi:hypothetical protein
VEVRRGHGPSGPRVAPPVLGFQQRNIYFLVADLVHEEHHCVAAKYKP